MKKAVPRFIHSEPGTVFRIKSDFDLIGHEIINQV